MYTCNQLLHSWLAQNNARDKHLCRSRACYRRRGVLRHAYFWHALALHKGALTSRSSSRTRASSRHAWAQRSLHHALHGPCMGPHCS